MNTQRATLGTIWYWVVSPGPHPRYFCRHTHTHRPRHTHILTQIYPGIDTNSDTHTQTLTQIYSHTGRETHRQTYSRTHTHTRRLHPYHGNRSIAFFIPQNKFSPFHWNVRFAGFSIQGVVGPWNITKTWRSMRHYMDKTVKNRIFLYNYCRHIV